MSNMIDDQAVEEVTAAELDSAPFPEASRIPSAHTELESSDGKPDAFGDDATAAPVGVEDATIEPSDGGDVPVTYAAAAEALGSNNAGNEFGNSSVSPGQSVANSTNAETLTDEGKSESESPEPKKAVRGGVRKSAGGLKSASKLSE